MRVVPRRRSRDERDLAYTWHWFEQIRAFFARTAAEKRAVMFSALTTATAFGSLWLSSHPGTSSMGKLMALALVTTMCAAVLFQPVLMGPPRDKKKKPEVPLLEAPKPEAAAVENVATS